MRKFFKIFIINEKVLVLCEKFLANFNLVGSTNKNLDL